MPEDAHVFGTTVLENLRVARGDLGPDAATAALHRAGLGAWLAALPDGLDTLLGPDARTVSGGERRRLLLARALVSPRRCSWSTSPPSTWTRRVPTPRSTR